MSIQQQLSQIIAPAVEAVGFEFVGIEFKPAGKHSMLRVYIDSENGINVDDCVEVSQQVSAVMDVEDPISNEYRLEVSSPGAERPLFTLQHFIKFQGEEVSLKLKSSANGRKKFKGKMSVIDETKVNLNVDGENYCFEVHQIEQANIVPNW
jgi:ribosome maturation factor RimP